MPYDVSQERVLNVNSDNVSSTVKAFNARDAKSSVTRENRPARLRYATGLRCAPLTFVLRRLAERLIL